MKTVTLDIIKDEAINLLQDLEALNIIRIQETNVEPQMSAKEFAAK